MKVNFKQSKNILFSLFSSILFLSYSIYDYYENDFFDGLGLFILLFILWIISLITSLIFLIKKKCKKQYWKAILINIASITIALSYSSLVENTQMRNFQLPRNIDIDKTENFKFVHYSQDSSQFIVLKYKEPPAFGSGHNILGLYSIENKIIDECLFGEFPLQFINWENDKLEFKAISYSGNYEYIKMWIARNHSISNYRLEIDIEEKE